MFKQKILCLGNEFIKEDSMAKKIANELNEFDFVNINDSFQLIDYINENKNIIILDVVENLDKVAELSIDDLKESRIISAHDFDAGFLLKLLDEKDRQIKIIGVPQSGDVGKIKEDVHSHLTLRK
ncbi:MAG TPA: hypothetical protein ENG87_02950 [Candidatus Pacearchaeota archaeon]|nr:hypothetical protein BMS3Abin17_00320 [archaeon BMS3Abin17]HDK42310.1 hypothetical protein [Candidatus Pacearchaeota archaeon]HDZ61313.1 hypothetical protein [Candidatus Pacearchaeota archaeon]